MLQVEEGIYHGHDKNWFFIDGYDNEITVTRWVRTRGFLGGSQTDAPQEKKEARHELSHQGKTPFTLSFSTKFNQNRNFSPSSLPNFWLNLPTDTIHPLSTALSFSLNKTGSFLSSQNSPQWSTFLVFFSFATAQTPPENGQPSLSSFLLQQPRLLPRMANPFFLFLLFFYSTR